MARYQELEQLMKVCAAVFCAGVKTHNDIILNEYQGTGKTISS